MEWKSPVRFRVGLFPQYCCFFFIIIIITKRGSDLLGGGNPTAIRNLLIVVAYNAKLYWYNSNYVEVYIWSL